MRFDTIRKKVNEWNPIGVDGLPDDEYDCLVEKIENLVADEIELKELIIFIEEDLHDHFGLDDVDTTGEFVKELLDVLQELDVTPND